MGNQSSVFRKVSLDRLSSPEQLDQKLTVISPLGWVSLLSLSILILAALGWGFLGSVSDKIYGNGVLMYGDGVVTLVSHSSGQITDISVQAGDYVESDQIIAAVSQEELERQIELCNTNISALEAVQAETLDLDIDSLNSEIYPEFAQLAGQIRSARIQYEAQEDEAYKNEQDIANQRAVQKEQARMIESQIETLENQIAEYEELLMYQRMVDLENAQAQDRQKPQVSGAALYTSDNGDYYRRNFAAPFQLAVMDQVGANYVILSNSSDESCYPVYYIDSTGTEIENPLGGFYLPNYYDSIHNPGTYAALPRRALTVFYDSMTGIRYIDLTGWEFHLVTGEELPSVYEQVENRPGYDATLASMNTQLESYRLQLKQAQLQESHLKSTFTDYLWGGYNQTGEQITSLMEQFAALKQIKRQDYIRQLNDLQTRYAKDRVIKAGFSGTMSGMNIQLYDFVQPGSTIGNIVPDESEDGEDGVILYVPLDKGKLVHEGMEVGIAPATVNREEHGYIIGRVEKVSVYAVTQEHMMATLQNQQLVQTFGGQSAVIELVVEPLKDTGTVSGYKWSTPKGPNITIDPGTVCAGEITISQKRPIDLVIPFIKRLFSGGAQ